MIMNTMTSRCVVFLLVLQRALSLTLNIHLPLSKVNFTWGWEQCPYNAAMEANLALRQANPSSEQINFFQFHSPHLTLFLSEFDVDNTTEDNLLKEITSTVQDVVSNHTQTMCDVVWPADPKSVAVYGAYAMYPIVKTPCLQQLSDDLVLALNPYIRRPPTVPAWIYNLPIIPRWRKIWLINKYGSPNVFGDFDPHVTVGYDEETTVESRKNLLQDLSGLSLECKGTLSTVSVAKVGVGGSVLQDGVVQEFLLPDMDTSGMKMEE